MKKALRILGLGAVAVLGTAGLAACGGDDSDLVIGMVCIGEPSTSSYDANFKDALDATREQYAKDGYKVKTIYKRNVGEKEDAEAAAKELAEECDVIILDSYGHQEFGYKVAQDNPNVQVISCTGDTALVKKISNYHNAFANIYEGRYLAGIAAGMKLNALGNDHVLGYVAAWPFSEVISGYTAFYLGAKSVCSDVTMKYTVTSSWGDDEKENSGAEKLINAGCKVISQHADTYGAPRKCAEKGVPNVSYNKAAKGDNLDATYLGYSRINWQPYFNHVVDCMKNGKTLETDWCAGLKEGSVEFELGGCAADGTQAKIDEAAGKIKAGTLNVFDCANFTVTVKQPDENGKNGLNADATVDTNGKLTAYKADVDGDFVGDTNVIENGVFKESSKRSAPYFNCLIDGITCID